MDLQLYFRALWRFRLLVGIGVVIAVALAFLALVRVSFDGGSPQLRYRNSEVWQSQATVLVTERHFPLGRSVFKELVLPTSSGKAKTVAPPNAPSTRFTELAGIYAAMATSDPVQRLVRQDGPLRGTISATALLAANGSDAPLPMVSIVGISKTPHQAMMLASRGAAGLERYIEIEQRDSGIPKDERAVLATIKKPAKATTQLLSGRSKTLPIVVFATVMLAFVGLAFVLENLRPRLRPVAEPAKQVEDVRTRRPA